MKHFALRSTVSPDLPSSLARVSTNQHILVPLRVGSCEIIWNWRSARVTEGLTCSAHFGHSKQATQMWVWKPTLSRPRRGLRVAMAVWQHLARGGAMRTGCLVARSLLVKKSHRACWSSPRDVAQSVGKVAACNIASSPMPFAWRLPLSRKSRVEPAHSCEPSLLVLRSLAPRWVLTSDPAVLSDGGVLLLSSLLASKAKSGGQAQRSRLLFGHALGS